MGGVRQWVMDGTLHPIKGFFRWMSCANKEPLLERYLRETSPTDILSAAKRCDWLRRPRKKKEKAHWQDIPSG